MIVKPTELQTYIVPLLYPPKLTFPGKPNKCEAITAGSLKIRGVSEWHVGSFELDFLTSSSLPVNLVKNNTFKTE